MNISNNENKTLPNSVDLRPYCSPVKDQRDLGSCSGIAIVGALEFLENKYHTFGNKFTSLSSMFVYYNERLLEGNKTFDVGAHVKTGIRTLSLYGACTEEDWPYETNRFGIRPNNNAYARALDYRIKSCVCLDSSNLQQIKSVLASEHPIVFGMSSYSSFMSYTTALTGVVTLPSNSEFYVGGHAVMLVGYDEETFIVRNSWGPNWGQNGYFTIPHSYFTDPNLVFDVWAILGS